MLVKSTLRKPKSGGVNSSRVMTRMLFTIEKWLSNGLDVLYRLPVTGMSNGRNAIV